MNAIEITRAYKGRWHGRYGMISCPAHADKTPSCKVSDGEIRPVFHCFAGCDWRDVVQAVERDGLLPAWHPKKERNHAPATNPPPHLSNRNEADVVKKRTYAQEIWRECEPVSGTLVKQYFAIRGLPDSCEYGGFHSGLKEPATGKSFPTWVLPYTSYSGEFDGIQRVFLDPETGNKADVPNAKLSLGTFPGSMIRLGNISLQSEDWPYYGPLGLIEGPEDGLSIPHIEGLPDVPIWVAGGGEKMALADLPQPIEALHIFADNGAAGKRFAKKALSAHVNKVRKIDGVPLIQIHYPPAQFDDFNLMLKARQPND